ncbi:MAG: hypothetical protein H6564_01505 [Lewinellaceae bacterium]|nr:hypothetical protein [Lewinellaceae bacterium]
MIDFSHKSKPGIRDISHLVQSHEENALRLKGVLDAKIAYLRKSPDNRRVRQELRLLQQFLVETHNLIGQFVDAYTRLSGEYICTHYELQALEHALPEDRSIYQKSREVMGLWHLVYHHKLPRHRLPIEVIRKTERLDQRISRVKPVDHGASI